MIDTNETLGMIVNFLDVVDGIYELVTINISRDWETGYVDDYDYKLIPYEDES